MNLKARTDNELITFTQKLVSDEREILMKVLHHLREIQRRRLFSSLGYKSLFDFAVKHLGYAESAAYRRINAMKLLKEIPAIEEQITEGSLNLSHLGLAQNLFRSQEFSVEQKVEILGQIAHKSVREAEKVTASFCPEAPRPDRVKLVTPTQVEMKFWATAEVQEKIERLRGYLAHKHPQLSLGELFDQLCDLGIKEWSPSLSNKSRIKRAIFAHAQDQCENCGSPYAPETDHEIPRGFGGSSEPENLRSLCRNCNQRAAILAFGLNKMDGYLNPL